MRVLQTDECDEEADTDGYGDLEGCRDRVEDRFSDVGKGEDDEDQTFHEDSCQSHLPGITHSQDYGVSEVSVKTHTCGEHERKVCKKCHQERGDCRSQCRRCKDRTCVHAGCAQDAGIYSQDVSHCHEGSKTCCQLCFDISAVLLQFEKLFHRVFPLSIWDDRVPH